MRETSPCPERSPPGETHSREGSSLTDASPPKKKKARPFPTMPYHWADDGYHDWYRDWYDGAYQNDHRRHSSSYHYEQGGTYRGRGRGARGVGRGSGRNVQYDSSLRSPRPRSTTSTDNMDRTPRRSEREDRRIASEAESPRPEARAPSVERNLQEALPSQTTPADDTMRRGADELIEPKSETLIVADPMRNIFSALQQFAKDLEVFVQRCNESVEKQVKAERAKQLSSDLKPAFGQGRNAIIEAAEKAAKAKQDASNQLKADLEIMFGLSQDIAVERARSAGKNMIIDVERIDEVERNVRQLRFRQIAAVEERATTHEQRLVDLGRQFKINQSELLAIIEDMKKRAAEEIKKREELDSLVKAHDDALHRLSVLPEPPTASLSSLTGAPDRPASETSESQDELEAETCEAEHAGGIAQEGLRHSLQTIEDRLEEMHDEFDERLNQLESGISDGIKSAIEERVEDYRHRKRLWVEAVAAKSLEHTQLDPTALALSRQLQTDAKDTTMAALSRDSAASRAGGAQSNDVASKSSEKLLQSSTCVTLNPSAANADLRARMDSQLASCEVLPGPGALDTEEGVVVVRTPSDVLVNVPVQAVEGIFSLVKDRLGAQIRAEVLDAMKAEYRNFRHELPPAVDTTLRNLAMRQNNIFQSLQRHEQQFTLHHQDMQLQRDVLENHAIGIQRLDFQIASMIATTQKIPEIIPSQRPQAPAPSVTNSHPYREATQQIGQCVQSGTLQQQLP